jgi:hypothetical protein
MCGLTEVLHNNSCCNERKHTKEIRERLRQNVRKMTGPGLVLAGQIGCLEADTSPFDVTKRGCCGAEYSGQFFVKDFGAKAFEKEEFDDESLPRLCDLVT